MNYPCTKKIALRRLLTLTAALVLLSSLLAGCFGIGKDPDPTDDTGNLPNLVDESTTPSSDAASATTDPEIPENTAIVKEQVNVRSTPSNTAPILTQLDAGVQSEVLMLKTVHGIEWAYLTQGWVPCEALDMSHVTLTSNSTDTPASTDPTADTPTETTKATEPDNSGSQTSTSGKSYGVVTTEELNIRSEASIDGTKVGSYSYGTRLTFTETSNGWGKTNKGWVSLKYVYMDGDNGSNGCSGVVTAAAGLNVRTGPGSNYDRVKTLAKGTKVTVKERIKINGTYWGYASGGWICMDYVDVDGETNNNNTTTTTGNGNGTVTGNGLYIRSGAGTDYDTVGSLKKGDRVTIQETQTVDGVKWGRISQGWICLTYVKMD